MKDAELANIVSLLVKDCQSYRNELSQDRDKMMEYYDGEMKDVVAEQGRSQVVSRDVKAIIKKVKPSVMRIILGNDKVVEYCPVSDGSDEQDNLRVEQAAQATDYVNSIVFPESNGPEAVEDAIDDALKLRNGIIRWWFDKRITTSVSSHTGLPEEELVQLVADDDVEVIEQSTQQEQIVTEQGAQEITTYNVKIRRKKVQGKTLLAAVPPEELLVHPDALDIAESPITGINKRLRRSELVAMGYDRDKIETLSMAAGDIEQDSEEDTRRREVYRHDDMVQRQLQEVEYYELYVRVDADDDGIAELRRLVFAGGLGVQNLLENEECDEVPFADIICARRPHQREGDSISDDEMEIQKIKTVLLRQTLDNLYWQNMPQPTVQEGVIVNPDAVLNPSFGKPIRVKQGTDARAAVAYNPIPFVAEQSFGMLEYLDKESTDRTGISDASSGMAPDALQNMTAKATALIEQGGIGQTELMVKTIARGLKRVFEGLLKTIIKHQDVPRTVYLRGQWVTFDPRQWNAGMNATVNTGLGAGTRERDMMMMTQIIGLQKDLLLNLGPDNPFVKPDNLYNAVTKFAESAGAKATDQYFTKPDPQEIAQKMQAAANKPDPAALKVQADAQASAQKAQLDAQNQQQKAQFDLQIQSQQQQQDYSLEMERMNREFALKQEQLNRELELKRNQLIAELELKRQQNAAEIELRQQVSPPTSSPVEVGGQPG
jgi:hypothetical protein